MNNDEHEYSSAVMGNMPDLLNFEPRLPLNVDDLRDDLQYAFSSGESSGALRMSLANYEVSESSWEEDCFAGDLFLDELIESSFVFGKDRFEGDFIPPQSRAYLKKVLVNPPGSMETVLFRQAIQRELLGNTEMREQFELVYQRLAELRELLDSSGLMGSEYSTRRRIDILIEIKRTIDLLAQGFENATSGITRIRDWAREFKAGEGYAKLRDFVDYEGRLSSVHLQLRVGVDGSVRNFQITGLSENSESRFYTNPFVRFWGWFSLFLRGYKVSRDELVARIVENVFDSIDGPLSHFAILIGHMEFHLASLTFKGLCEERGLRTAFPEFRDGREGRVVEGLFNPLLFGQEKEIVTCDLSSDRQDTMMVITGPNSGGKTRLLQSLGLVQLLGQGGMVVPASRAEVHFKSGLFVSLMENNTATQEEGRLGTELLRIRRLFELSPRGALIILDELCSGTNPSEGEEIFLLVMSLLRELEPEVYITTHFLRFAHELAREHAHLGLEFRQVDLDEQQEPTYKFVAGVASTSLAGHTARRLGVTREHLLSLVEKRNGEKPRIVPDQGKPQSG